MSFQILVFLIEYDDKNYSRRYLDEIKIQLKDEKNLTLSYQNISLNKYFKKFVLQVVYQFNDYYLQPYLFRPQEIKENMEENIFGTGRNLSFKIEDYQIIEMMITIELKMLMNPFPLKKDIMTVSEFLLEFHSP